MAERGMIFTAESVRAILAGRKTQTRRVLKRQPERFAVDDSGTLCDVGLLHVDGDPWPRVTTGRVITLQEVRFAVGQRLWVREAFAKVGDAEDDIHACPDLRVWAYYRADAVCPEHQKWRSPLFMPRNLSRLTLTVTDVRVERLQDISEADARAEGHLMTHDGRCYDAPPPEVDSWQGYGRASFSLTWSKIHGKDAWDTNPWVAAITFTPPSDHGAAAPRDGGMGG